MTRWLLYHEVGCTQEAAMSQEWRPVVQGRPPDLWWETEQEEEEKGKEARVVLGLAQLARAARSGREV